MLSQKFKGHDLCGRDASVGHAGRIVAQRRRRNMQFGVFADLCFATLSARKGGREWQTFYRITKGWQRPGGRADGITTGLANLSRTHSRILSTASSRNPASDFSTWQRARAGRRGCFQHAAGLPRLPEPGTGRGKLAGSATRHAHRDASHRTRSATRLDRATQTARQLNRKLADSSHVAATTAAGASSQSV
jgi:hypothetical protein